MKNQSNNTKLITFGGGSFWCTQAIFQEVIGVVTVTSGYSGGTTDECPSHQVICSGMTGHAEVIQVEYQPSVITFEELIVIFMTTHDPTLLNEQGTDKGTQFRSIIFYECTKERAAIDLVFQEVQTYFEQPILTEIKHFERFFEAEKEHQHYYQLNKRFGYCTTVIEPKLAEFRKQYSKKLKPTI